MVGESVLRRLDVLAGKGGGPMTKGWAIKLVHGGGWYGKRRLADDSGPLIMGSAPCRRLAVLAGEGGGPTTKGWAMKLVHGGRWYGEQRRQLSGTRVT